jgi:hypothetical protein
VSNSGVVVVVVVVVVGGGLVRGRGGAGGGLNSLSAYAYNPCYLCVAAALFASEALALERPHRPPAARAAGGTGGAPGAGKPPPERAEDPAYLIRGP